MDKDAPVNVAGKIKVGYRADIINIDHMEANNRIGCTYLQKMSVTGLKITLCRNRRGLSKVFINVSVAAPVRIEGNFQIGEIDRQPCLV